MAYQMECCGDLPTRFGKLNSAVQTMIHYIRTTGNSYIPYEVSYNILQNLGIYPLSQSEQNYVLNEVQRGV